MQKTRRKDIDFIKVIACFMIVILHAINPGERIQESVYLIGTYGIPLFLW